MADGLTVLFALAAGLAARLRAGARFRLKASAALTRTSVVIDAGQRGFDLQGLSVTSTCCEACRMKDIRAETPVRPDMIWDLLIRISGIALFVLLVVAYSTGDEFQETHMMIGYAIAALVVAGIFWVIVRPHHDRFPAVIYSPYEIKAQFQNANRVPKTLAFVFLILAALPFCALLLMLLTHTLWGTTWIDEMHEVAAYFAVGLVAPYIAMVGIACSGYVEDRVRKMLKGNKHPH